MPSIDNQELAEFLEGLDDSRSLLRGFDYLPDVFFFVKDRNSRLMTANRAYCRLIGVDNPEEITGRDDYDFYSPEMTKHYIEDDQKVFASGKPLENRLEPCSDEFGNLDWFCTTKVPLFDKDGEIVGLFGIMRRSAQISHEGCSGSIKSLMKHIKENLDQPLTLEELSTVAKVSVRQLTRQIRELFDQTPHVFVMRMRVQAACEALVNTDHSLLEIATSCGFSDQSAFTKIFHRQMGHTPRKFRKLYKKL